MTADAILEKPFEVVIGGVTYKVAPPCTATLIEVSAEVARLPKYQIDYNKNKQVSETLRIAKDCKTIGSILAILILGIDNLTETIKTPKKRFLWWVTEWEEKVIDKKAELADFILRRMLPSEINKLTTKILAEKMEIGDFFGFTTSLIEINLTRPTKEVEN